MKKAFLLALLAITLNLSAQSTTYFAKPLELNAVPVSTSKSDSVVVWSNKILKHVPRSEFTEVPKVPSLLDVTKAGANTNIPVTFYSQNFNGFTYVSGDDVSFVDNNTLSNFKVDGKGLSKTGVYGTVNLNVDRTAPGDINYNLDPNKAAGDYTIATLDDIPSGGNTSFQSMFDNDREYTTIKEGDENFSQGVVEVTPYTVSLRRRLETINANIEFNMRSRISETDPYVSGVLQWNNNNERSISILPNVNYTGDTDIYLPLTNGTSKTLATTDDVFPIAKSITGTSYELVQNDRLLIYEGTDEMQINIPPEGIFYPSYPIGYKIQIVRGNTGTLNINRMPGVNMVSDYNTKGLKPYHSVMLTKIGTNRWYVESLETHKIIEPFEEDTILTLDEYRSGFHYIFQSNIGSTINLALNNAINEGSTYKYTQEGDGALTLVTNGNVIVTTLPLVTTKGESRTLTKIGVNKWLMEGTLATTEDIKLKSYTVSTLPAGAIGDRAFVTDATAPTYLGALAGGGSVICPVFYNGTTWVSH